METNDEALRLQELRSYNILFTPPEAAFDRITALAKRLFDVPIVLISLVDEDFQWFKSCIGLQISSTSREVSFCQHTLTAENVMIIPDATLDPRFADNALVTGPPGVRFYAGAPLVSPRGLALGALCIIDTVPHPHGLPDSQRDTLVDLAGMVLSELELRSANERIGAASAALERSNEHLANFANIVSHDLQSPVRTINIFSQMLRRSLGTRLSADEDQQFALISSAATGMGNLITGLLKFAQAGQQQIRPETVPLEEVVADIINNLQSAIQESKAQIIYDSLPTIYADRLQISQLFQNLIANAIKYRSPGRPPQIQITQIQNITQTQNIAQIENGERCQIRIEDNGLGIAARDLQRIFEPLTRLHGSEIPGSGLGLAICRSIVQRHNGQLSVDSVVGTGSTFTIDLPLPAGC